MNRSSLLLIGLLAAALVYVGASQQKLGRRLERSEAALARALAQQRSSARSLSECEATRGDAAEASRAGSLPEDACDCANAPECPEPIELVVTPEGNLLKSPEEREAYVRAHLERRIAAAFPDEEMDERTREEAVALLVRIRALRGGTAAAEPGRPDALGDAEEAFIELTGMGVGEFLARAHTRQPVRDPGSEQAARLLQEAPAKRFASELDRMLGIAEPGAAEALEEQP